MANSAPPANVAPAETCLPLTDQYDPQRTIVICCKCSHRWIGRLTYRVSRGFRHTERPNCSECGHHVCGRCNSIDQERWWMCWACETGSKLHAGRLLGTNVTCPGIATEICPKCKMQRNHSCVVFWGKYDPFSGQVIATEE